jgi:1-acyl-sn-glycerol-3-phosphate acyltransferase
MRRLRNDLPYRFRPPVTDSWVRPLGLLVNRLKFLKLDYRIMEIRDSGFERVAALCEAGHAVLLAPNHSDHSDPHVLVELASRFGLRPAFMGAREIFETSDFASWALQNMGVFSVDREGPDISAIKTAIQLLQQGGQPLVVFPEGEIYHHHRRLDPLNEGVASILLKAAAKMRDGQKAYLVPVAMRFHHDPSVKATFDKRLSLLENHLGWTSRKRLDLDERIRCLAVGAIALKEAEFLGESKSGPIHDRLGLLSNDILGEVEQRYPRDAKASTVPERVRALRYRIRKRLLDPENPPDDVERETLLDDLDRVFTALQAHSYIGDYLDADQTLDRRAEVILKLEEDLLDHPTYPVPRWVSVDCGDPVCVSDMLADGTLEGKGAALELTALLETKLGAMLE